MKTTRTRTLLMLTAACALLFAPALWISAPSAAAETAPFLFENFDDYDTGCSRQGVQGGIYQQMANWTGAAATFTAEAGIPVGAAVGKSLKITQRSNRAMDVWSNGSANPALCDRTGAKYVRIYVRNLSSMDKELGFYITDILQSTIDSWAAAAENTIPDAGQEHWRLKWNSPVVLETLSGEKSIVRSVSGSTVNIPKGFDGSVCIPLDESALVMPDWYLAEGHSYGNGKLDLDRIFIVSFHLPEATNISSADSQTWTVFELDNIYFCYDGDVDALLEADRRQEAAKAEEKIRPSSSAVAVDFQNFTITVKSGTTLGGLKSLFSLPAGYRIVVKTPDGFEVTQDGAKLEAGSEITFTDDKSPFTFTLKIQQDGKNGGCKGGAAVLQAAGLCLLMFAFLRKGGIR